MKKLSIILTAILFNLLIYSVNIYADTSEEKIWMADDEVFNDYEKSNTAVTLDQLTFMPGVDMLTSTKNYKGDKLYRYFKLDNKGDINHNSIKFNVTGACDIYVIANSNNNGEARDVVAYFSSTEKEQYITVNEPTGYKIEYRGNSDSIYLYAAEMPIRVYGIAIRYYPYSSNYNLDGSLSSAIEDYNSYVATENVVFAGIKFYATAENPVYIGKHNATNKYGQNYYRSVDLTGSGTSTYKTIGVPVKANSYIYLTVASTNINEARTVIITNKYYENICDELIITPEVNTYKIKYTGSGDEILFRSKDSGIRFYDIDVIPMSNQVCYDNTWNINSNSNFTVQSITSSKEIDGLFIYSNAEIMYDQNNTKIIRKTINNTKSNCFRFNMSDSSGTDNTKINRELVVKAGTQCTSGRLVLMDQMGYVYDSAELNTGIGFYNLSYNGEGEKIYLYGISDSGAANLDIYSISTSMYTNKIQSSSKTLNITNGETYQLYLMTGDNPQANCYTYKITYDSSKLSFLNTGFKDGTYKYSDNYITITENNPGIIEFKSEREDINLSALLATVKFKAKADGETVVEFSAEIDT